MKWVILLIIIYIYNYYQSTKVKEYNYIDVSQKVHSEFRLVQISDFHLNGRIDLESITRDLEEFSPRAIVLTGDMVNRDSRNFREFNELLKAIYSPNWAILFVTGNHEYENSKLAEFKSLLLDYGVITFEKNRIYPIREDLRFIGLNYGEESISESLKSRCYSIVLVHSFYIFAHKNNNLPEVDLILSGHTHAGQVRFPILGQLIGHNREWLPKYSKGEYILDNKSKLYISGGLGNSSLNIRALNRVGYTKIKIKPQK